MTPEHTRRQARTARATRERIYRAAVDRATNAGSSTPIGDAVEHLVNHPHFKETNR